jgi:FlaA1/EpsC-like NDP-sugar epimerase
MTALAKIFGLLARAWYEPRRAIILGAGSQEYGLFCRLEREREYRVLFFIDEEPWNHRTTIGSAELRYPSELVALCENHQIEAIFYCDEDRVLELPELPCEIVKLDA